MKHKTIGMMCATALAVGLSMPAAAQQTGGQTEQDYQWWQQQQQQQPQRYQQQQQQQHPFRQFQQQRLQQMQPVAGIVRIACDVDNDGTVDVVDYVFITDLEQARQRARARLSGQAGFQGMPGMAGDQQFDLQQARARMHQQLRNPQIRQHIMEAMTEGRFDDPIVHQWLSNPMVQQRMREALQYAQSQQYGFGDTYGYFQESPHAGMQQTASGQFKTQGTIQKLESKRLVGMRDRHAIATIQTYDGQTVQVDLGPRNQITDLNLSQGDQVTISGTLGMLNDRPIVIATEIQTQDDMVQIQREQPRHYIRIAGEVLDTQNVSFQGVDEQHTVAAIELPSGQTALIDLGPTNEVQNLNIQSGQRIAVLGTPVRIDGQRALQAHQVRAQNQIARIQHTTERQQLQSESPQQLRRMQQQQQQQRQQQPRQQQPRQQQQDTSSEWWDSN